MIQEKRYDILNVWFDKNLKSLEIEQEDQALSSKQRSLLP
jgi:hypothetical protein